MIAPKQIGWSEKANLLWEISRQLDRTLAFMCTGPCPTTTTTTTLPPTTTTTTTAEPTTTTTTTALPCICYTITNLQGFNDVYSYLDCDGVLVEDLPILNGQTISFCAQQDSIKGADVVIVDNGACGEFCPPL